MSLDILHPRGPRVICSTDKMLLSFPHTLSLVSAMNLHRCDEHEPYRIILHIDAIVCLWRRPRGRLALSGCSCSTRVSCTRRGNSMRVPLETRREQGWPWKKTVDMPCGRSEYHNLLQPRAYSTCRTYNVPPRRRSSRLRTHFIHIFTWRFSLVEKAKAAEAGRCRS